MVIYWKARANLKRFWGTLKVQCGEEVEVLAAVVFRLLLMFFTNSRISIESSSHSSSSDTSPSKLPPLEASKDPRLSCLKLRKGVTNNNIGTQSDLLTRPKIFSAQSAGARLTFGSSSVKGSSQTKSYTRKCTNCRKCGKRRTRLSWTPSSQAASESRILEWKY